MVLFRCEENFCGSFDNSRPTEPYVSAWGWQTLRLRNKNVTRSRTAFTYPQVPTNTDTNRVPTPKKNGRPPGRKKQRVARDLRREAGNDQLRLAFMKGDAGLPRFWQPRFHDFNVYSRYKLRKKLEYMHGNPVKRGLVKNSGEWIQHTYRNP